jgi:hypothetical protein
LIVAQFLGVAEHSSVMSKMLVSSYIGAMHDHGVQSSMLTRRRVLGGMGLASLALMSSPASAQETVDLHVPGGPSTRVITTSYPQKGRMILQRTSPPWLETPFEVFDKGVFTPNDQHYVSWHWAFSGRHRCG